MGGSQSKSQDEEVNMHELGGDSNKEKKDVDDVEQDDDVHDPLQRLFFFLRKAHVDVDAVNQLLNSEGKLNLNAADVQPELPADMDPKNPLYIKMKERISKKTFLGDYALHLLVGRPSSQNTPELVGLVKIFFLRDHPMNCRNSLGSTPLMRACAAGNAVMAKELIAWGAEADVVNSMQHTCLHMACYAGHTEVVKLLLENGCAKHLNFKCVYGIAPVDYVLKDDIYQLLKAAHKTNKTGASSSSKQVKPAVVEEVKQDTPVEVAVTPIPETVEDDVASKKDVEIEMQEEETQ